MNNILAIILVITLLLGCTSNNNLSLKEKDKVYSAYVNDEKLPSQNKITGFRFSRWQSLSDHYLIITATHKKDYLIETKGRCYGLSYALNIKLNRTSNSSLSAIGDSISPIGEVNVKCYIKSIHPISNDQIDHLVNIGKSVEN